jgi:hypothetical protein
MSPSRYQQSHLETRRPPSLQGGSRNRSSRALGLPRQRFSPKAGSASQSPSSWLCTSQRPRISLDVTRNHIEHQY